MESFKVVLLLALCCVSVANCQIFYQQAQSAPVGQTLPTPGSLEQTSSVTQNVPSAKSNKPGDISPLNESGKTISQLQNEDLAQKNGLPEVEQSLDEASVNGNTETQNKVQEAPIVGQSILSGLGAQLLPCPMNIFSCFPALTSLMSWGRTFPGGSLLGAPLDTAPEASKVVLVLADDEPFSDAKDSEKSPANRVVRQSMLDQFVQQTNQAYQQMLQQWSQAASTPSGGGNIVGQALEQLQQGAGQSAGNDFVSQAIQSLNQAPNLSQLLQQTGQSSGGDLLSQAFQSLNQAPQGLGQLLQQGSGSSGGLPNILSQLSQNPFLQQFVGQSLGQTTQTSSGSDPSVGSALEQGADGAEVAGDGATASAGATTSEGGTLGQAAPGQPFNQALSQFSQIAQAFSGITPLSLFPQQQAQASEISEVRVKPDFAFEKQESSAASKTLLNDKLNDMKNLAMLQEALQKKNIPILWFRLPATSFSKKTNGTTKSVEELKIESKLRDFEKQVVAELQLLQELERIAKQMRLSTKLSKSNNKEALYKLSYPLSQTPVYKITKSDIEKALNDEYLKKLLQRAMLNQKNDQTNTPQFILKPNTNPFKRQAAGETIAKQMNKEDIIKMMAYAYRMAKDKGEDTPWMLEQPGTNMERKPIKSFRENMADAKQAADRQRQQFDETLQMKQMNQRRQMDDIQQRTPEMTVDNMERQRQEQQQWQGPQMPMDNMQRQWMEEQRQRTAQHRQWAEDSMKHIQNFNTMQLSTPQSIQMNQMDTSRQMQPQRQMLDQMRTNTAEEQQRQWANMQQQLLGTRMEDLNNRQSERQWLDEKNKNIAEQKQRQWIEMQQQKQSPQMTQMEAQKTSEVKEERQWAEEQLGNQQTMQMPMTDPKNMQRQMAEDSLKNTGLTKQTSDAKEENLNKQGTTLEQGERQWAKDPSENVPKSPSEERQWAEKSMGKSGQMSDDQIKMKSDQRQWADENSRNTEMKLNQDSLKQWLNPNEGNQQTQPMGGIVQGRQWVDTASRPSQQMMMPQVVNEQSRQWADHPTQIPQFTQQQQLMTPQMQAPMAMLGRSFDGTMMNSQTPFVGEATPQMAENAGKARHKGFFDDLDIFDLDGGSKKKGKDKNSKPTIINYYYGGGYPAQYSPPPSYGGRPSYGERPSYGTSYGGGSYGGGSYGGGSYGGSYGRPSYSSRPSSYSSNSYGSNPYGSGSQHGNYRTAVGDGEIQLMLQADQSLGVTHFRK